MNEKCGCVDVKMGSYDNQITVLAPSWSSREYLCLDRCVAIEVLELWTQGIVTTGCCCSHNLERASDPFIGVMPEYIPKMKELGYKVAFNSLHPHREDSFTPKTFMVPKEIPA